MHARIAVSADLRIEVEAKVRWHWGVVIREMAVLFVNTFGKGRWERQLVKIKPVGNWPRNRVRSRFPFWMGHQLAIR